MTSIRRIVPAVLLRVAGGLAAATPRPMVGAAAPLAAGVGDPVLPDTAAGRCAKEFLAMINEGSPEGVRKFENKWASKKRLGLASVDDRVGRVKDLHEEWRQ